MNLPETIKVGDWLHKFPKRREKGKGHEGKLGLNSWPFIKENEN